MKLKQISFSVTDKLKEKIDGKVKKGLFKSRGDYLRYLVNKYCIE